MPRFSQLYERIQKLDPVAEVKKAIEATEKQLADKQREQQLAGKNRKGEAIGRYRNPAYARLKNSMNPVPGLGIPDLKLTGEFHRSIYADLRGDKVIIDATDEKTEALAKRFSEAIFGLSSDYKADYVKEDLRPAFMVNIHKATGL